MKTARTRNAKTMEPKSPEAFPPAPQVAITNSHFAVNLPVNEPVLELCRATHTIANAISTLAMRISAPSEVCALKLTLPPLEAANGPADENGD